MPRRPRIAYVGDLSNAFQRRDLDILRKHFTVRVAQPPGSVSGWPGHVARLFRLAAWADVTFSWFGGWHSLPAVYFSRVFDKKSIVVGGGFDVVDLPEIGYGAWNNAKERIPARYCLGTADLVISVSRSNQKELLSKVEPVKNVLVYNGVDPSEFPFPDTEKEQMAVTVGGVNRMTLKRKGIDGFVRAAEYLPDVPFVVIGKIHDDAARELRDTAPPNVTFTGMIPFETLRDHLARAKVYAQPSAHEGFGISVAEAMLSGCIPVVTRRFALPEVVGDIGIYVPFDDPRGIAEGIGKALDADPSKGLKARERIVRRFPMERREKGLIKAIRSVL